MLTATLKLKLHTCREAESVLLETLRQSTACFNAVCDHGWNEQERNANRLHHATYNVLRSVYPDLPSQLHCAARVKAAEALKSADALLKQGRKAGRPSSDLCPVRYDARSYWAKLSEGCASLATVAGRVCVRFNVCGYYRRYLHGKTCSADLCYNAKERRFYLHVVVQSPSPEPSPCFDVLGVDLGIAELATDSDGNQYSGDAVKNVRRRVRRIRRLLQAKATKSAKRHLKRIRQKQSRFTRDTNHVISKRLVQAAIGCASLNVASAANSRKALCLEDLSGIRDRANGFSRECKWLMGNWAFDQLRQFLAYKCEAAGVPLLLVDPRNTSRTCSRCGHCEKANRKSQAKFQCIQCGFCLNADVNASLNIAAKARAASSNSLMFQPLLARQTAEPFGLGTSRLPLGDGI